MEIITQVIEQWNTGSGEVITALEVTDKSGAKVVFGCPSPDSAWSLGAFLDQTDYKIISVRQEKA